MTDEASVRHAAKLVEAEFGALDILVNNVGILRRPPLVNPRRLRPGEPG